MKKYDVYGIGNALLDIEIPVTGDFLTANNIDKGVMTLIDDTRQAELVEKLHGEHTKLQGGGSAANTVVAVSQFGGDAFYSCKVGDDEHGAHYLSDLADAGIDTVYSQESRPEGTTGKCLVMVTPDAERTMNTYLGITATLSTEELVEEAIKNSKYIYIEGYLVASPSGKEAAVMAKKFADKYDVKTAITFSDPNMVTYFREGLEEIIGTGVDLLFCNEQEALDFVGVKDLKVAREKLKEIAKTFVITQGKNGAMIFDGDTFIDIEPYKVEVQDTNGAGDMFAGAFLYGITRGHSFAQAGKLASLASSKIVSQFGPRLQWHEVKEVKNQITASED